MTRGENATLLILKSTEFLRTDNTAKASLSARNSKLATVKKNSMLRNSMGLVLSGGGGGGTKQAYRT